jgi:hypothetical protein
MGFKMLQWLHLAQGYAYWHEQLTERKAEILLISIAYLPKFCVLKTSEEILTEAILICSLKN